MQGYNHKCGYCAKLFLSKGCSKTHIASQRCRLAWEEFTVFSHRQIFWQFFKLEGFLNLFEKQVQLHLRIFARHDDSEILTIWRQNSKQYYILKGDANDTWFAEDNNTFLCLFCQVTLGLKTIVVDLCFFYVDFSTQTKKG